MLQPLVALSELPSDVCSSSSDSVRSLGSSMLGNSFQPLFQVADGLIVRRAVGRLLPRLVPIMQRLLVASRLGVVICDDLGMGFGPFGEPLFEQLPDLAVIAFALRLCEQVVSRVTDQGVLEVENRRPQHGAFLVEQFGVDQMAQFPAQDIGVQGRRGQEQFEIKCAAEDGRELQHPAPLDPIELGTSTDRAASGEWPSPAG